MTILILCTAPALTALDWYLRIRARRGRRRRARFCELTQLENCGAAFGLLASHPRAALVLGYAVYAAALALLFPAARSGGAWLRLGAVWITCGGASNLADRTVRGSVTDYLRFPRLPGRAGRLVWNIADFMILAGVMLILTSEAGV